MSVEAPKSKTSPTLPFSAAEMKRILEACERYPGNADRMKGFVLTMRHSSVRITERHHKPWVKTLQKKLEDEVRKAWG